MMRRVWATLLVLLVIYAVPFLVYGLASALTGLAPPTAASPVEFLLGVLVTKIGTAIAFVALFEASQSLWRPHWMRYAAIWFVMFALSEAGDALSGRSTAFMAALGVLSEAIYLPLSALLVRKLLRTGPT
jgi:hypothetical protein